MLQLKFLNLKVETAQKDTALAYTVQCGYPTVKTALLKRKISSFVLSHCKNGSVPPVKCYLAINRS